MKHKKRSKLESGLHYVALICPISSRLTTDWSQLLSCQTTINFVLAPNLGCPIFIDVLRPLFSMDWKTVSHGGSYSSRKDACGLQGSLTYVELLDVFLRASKSVKDSTGSVQYLNEFNLSYVCG